MKETRSTAETLELDLSLRQSRTIYVTLAAVLLPAALFGALGIVLAIEALVTSPAPEASAADAVLSLLFGVIAIGVEYAIIRQCKEANRRLKILREDPRQKVRKMKAPFQSSLFGPYH